MVPLDQFIFADSWFWSSARVRYVPMDISMEEWKKYKQHLLSLAEHWMLRYWCSSWPSKDMILTFRLSF